MRRTVEITVKIDIDVPDKLLTKKALKEAGNLKKEKLFKGLKRKERHLADIAMWMLMVQDNFIDGYGDIGKQVKWLDDKVLSVKVSKPQKTRQYGQH